MKVKPFRIPKNIVLPGLVVTVRVVPSSDSALDGRAGCWLYDDKHAVILIDGALPKAVQRYTLLHELQHVMVDLLDLALEEQAAYFKTMEQHRKEVKS